MLFRLSLAALAVVALAGCGKQGDLQRPARLFGEARVVLPSDRERGAPDETSTRENQREDARSPIPAPNEETRPLERGVAPTPAAPVNVPPTAN